MEKAAIYCRLSEEDHSKKHKTEDRQGRTHGILANVNYCKCI